MSVHTQFSAPAHTQSTGISTSYRWNPTVSYTVALDPTLSPNSKAVLLVILHHAGPEDQCWPGDDRLSQCTGLSIPTIQRTLRELEARSIIRRITDKKHGRLIRLVLTSDQRSDHQRAEPLPPVLTSDQSSDHQRAEPLITGDQLSIFSERTTKNTTNSIRGGEYSFSSVQENTEDTIPADTGSDWDMFAEPVRAYREHRIATDAQRGLLAKLRHQHRDHPGLAAVERLSWTGLDSPDLSRAIASEAITALQALVGCKVLDEVDVIEDED